MVVIGAALVKDGFHKERGHDTARQKEQHRAQNDIDARGAAGALAAHQPDAQAGGTAYQESRGEPLMLDGETPSNENDEQQHRGAPDQQRARRVSQSEGYGGIGARGGRAFFREQSHIKQASGCWESG